MEAEEDCGVVGGKGIESFVSDNTQIFGYECFAKVKNSEYLFDESVNDDFVFTREMYTYIGRSRTGATSSDVDISQVKVLDLIASYPNEPQELTSITLPHGA